MYMVRFRWKDDAGYEKYYMMGLPGSLSQEFRGIRHDMKRPDEAYVFWVGNTN